MIEQLKKAADWLDECGVWMTTNDLDMQCPMKDDPAELALGLRTYAFALECELGNMADRLNASSPTAAALDKPEEELRLKVAKAISIPQHHTTWDRLTEIEQDLYFQQADWAIKATDVERIERERDKYLWQVRDTCKRAEKAEAAALDKDAEIARLHDEVTRPEAALVCFVFVLMLPAMGVVALLDWMFER